MDLIDDPAPGSNTPEYTVGEIASAVKKLIEAELGWVRVRGEVGRVVLARSGHLYFDLKDDRNVLSCMTWKGQIGTIGVLPEEGMEVVAEGRMTASGFQSKFSLNALKVAVAGEGALMALLEKRKKALAAEGLFEDSRKKRLPYLPEVVGVITSPQGAVIRDILHRLRDRFPRKVLLWPVAVQGSACAPEVARAIEGFNRLKAGGALPRPDLLIVARGGGSIEDLWGFNEEVVARAAAASEIPLISAVGHETDTTLIDFTADRRAPTPTAAAEMAVPRRDELLTALAAFDARRLRALRDALDRRAQRLRDLSRALPRPEEVAAQANHRLDVATARLPRALQSVTERARRKLGETSGGLREGNLTRLIEAHADRLHAMRQRLERAWHTRLEAARQSLGAQIVRLNPRLVSRLATDAQKRIARATAAFWRAAEVALTRRKERMESLDRVRLTLGYQATLDRGYAVVRDPDGALLPDAAAASRATSLEIQFRDGKLTAIPKSSSPLSQTKRAAPRKPDQGELF